MRTFTCSLYGWTKKKRNNSKNENIEQRNKICVITITLTISIQCGQKHTKKNAPSTLHHQNIMKMRTWGSRYTPKSGLILFGSILNSINFKHKIHCCQRKKHTKSVWKIHLEPHDTIIHTVHKFQTFTALVRSPFFHCFASFCFFYFLFILACCCYCCFSVSHATDPGWCWFFCAAIADCFVYISNICQKKHFQVVAFSEYLQFYGTIFVSILSVFPALSLLTRSLSHFDSLAICFRAVYRHTSKYSNTYAHK